MYSANNIAVGPNVKITETGNLTLTHGTTLVLNPSILVISGGRLNVIPGFTTGVAVNESIIGPASFVVEQNYPNPFNPETTIRFQLSESRFVIIRIYNSLGQQIRGLVQNQLPAGYHTVQWNGKDNHNMDVSSGIYLYQMTAGGFSDIRTMTLIR
jgi:hypothetical protein